MRRDDLDERLMNLRREERLRETHVLQGCHERGRGVTDGRENDVCGGKAEGGR